MKGVYAFRDGRLVVIPYEESGLKLFSADDKPCSGEHPYITRTRDRILAGFETRHDGYNFLSTRARLR